MSWKEVTPAVEQAKAIIWDGCHKIYLSMDDEETETFRGYGYGDGTGTEVLRLTSEFENTTAVLELLHEWWDDSCGLRFISAVRTVQSDPNEGFTQLIAQFEEA